MLETSLVMTIIHTVPYSLSQMHQPVSFSLELPFQYANLLKNATRLRSVQIARQSVHHHHHLLYGLYYVLTLLFFIIGLLRDSVYSRCVSDDRLNMYMVVMSKLICSESLCARNRTIYRIKHVYLPIRLVM